MQIAHLGTGSTGSVQIVENKLADEETRRTGKHIFAAKLLHAGFDVDATAVAKHRCGFCAHSSVVSVEILMMRAGTD